MCVSKKLFSGVVVMLALAAGVVATAEAVPRDGGDWIYGVGGGRVWSNYWHPQANHGSSVQGMRFVDSGCQGPHVWARANAPSKPFASDGTFYRFC